jgi:hypothetical protein
MSDVPSRQSLLDELDARQDELLVQLDELNAKIEQVLAQFAGPREEEPRLRAAA